MKDTIQTKIQHQIEWGYLTKYRSLNLGDKVTLKHPYKPHTIVAFPACTTRPGHFVYAIANDGSEIRELTKTLTKITNEMANQNSQFNSIMLDLACKTTRDRSWWITMNMCGNHNKDTRQLFVEFLTGEKKPKSECGIRYLTEVVEENIERFITIVEEDDDNE